MREDSSHDKLNSQPPYILSQLIVDKVELLHVCIKMSLFQNFAKNMLVDKITIS